MIEGGSMAIAVYHCLQGLYITHMGDVLTFFRRENTLLNGLDCTLGTVLNLKFVEDMFKVGFKGITAHGKDFCYGIILTTRDYQVKYLFFPARQVDFKIGGSGFQILKRQAGQIRGYQYITLMDRPDDFQETGMICTLYEIS